MENKSIEVKAKNTYEAIQEAAEKLGVAQDELSIEVLKEGGMFSKAHIRATVKVQETQKATSEPTPTPAPKSESQDKKATKKPEVKSKDTPKDATKEKPIREQKVSTQETTNPDGTPIKFEKCTSFIKELLALLGNEAAVATELTEKSFNININGDNVGQLIGKSGAVLNALQSLVSSIAISNSHGENKRVYVNVGDYKERRIDTLQALALKKADYVKSSGRFAKLDPMNARDRAIIHTALSEIEGIRTYSTGKDPFRCLCIAPGEKGADKKSENPEAEAQEN